jgi:hypothetical protein
MMSFKTIRKKIAFVSVSALAAGLLAVVTAPIARAADGDININVAGFSQRVCSIQNAASGAFTTLAAAGNTGTSTLAAPLIVTLPIGGSIDVKGVNEGYTLQGYNLITSDTGTGYLQSNYGLRSATWDSTDTVTLTATAVGTVTIKQYLTVPFPNSATSYNSPNDVFGTGHNGVLTISIVAECSASGYSSTYSVYRVDNTAFAAGNANLTLTYGDTLTFGAGEDGYISIVGKNGYNAALPSTTSWVASATNNAKVLFGTSSTAIGAITTARGTLSSASLTAAGTSVYVRVTPASRTAGGTTTVTVTAGGTTVLTKTLTFLPEPTKLVITKNMIGSISGGEGAFSFELQDDAGVKVPGAISIRPLTLDSRVTNVTEVKAASIVPAAPAGNINTIAATTFFGSTTTRGIMKFNCNTATTSGSTTVTMRHTTAVSEVNIDTPVTLNCAGGLSTYTISLDKAAYKIGEIAKLTFTGKDSAGNKVHDFSAFTADALSVGGGSPVKNTATTDYFADGVKTYELQMTTAGTFNTVSKHAGSVTTSATAGPYTVSGGDASNTEVLAAIVKLIASINKQIKALQKSIRR